MTTLNLQAHSPNDILVAAHMLRAGEVLAMPTETVYGLAANALSPAAVAKIFTAKGRPQDNPLIVHIADAKQALPLVREFPLPAKQLAAAFWPGPLTMILPKHPSVPVATTAGLDTIALRVPNHPAALALLQVCELPLAAPSANRSGSPSPTTAQHVRDDLNGRIAAIVDGGACTLGVESTVLDLTGSTPVLLRPGGVTQAQIEQVLGREIAVSLAVTQPLGEHEQPASPGLKHRHYAPKAQLTLVHGTLRAFAAYAKREQPEGLLVFDSDVEILLKIDLPVCAIVPYGNDASEQAQQLFGALRELDKRRLHTVFVRPPAQDGIGLAAYNRLLRAADFRTQSPNFVLGLCGPTGAGKSTAATLLANMGCLVIDCDDLAREIVHPGSPVLRELAADFGAEIVRDDGTLNRGELAARAFVNADTRRVLNAITHKAITALAFERMRAAQGRVVVVDAAVLLESEIAHHCDHIAVITAPDDVRRARILARDGMTADAADQRMAAQANMDFSGHTTIDNAQGEEELAAKLRELLTSILPMDYTLSQL
ncbi:MAG: L-threonylcarbamoyladenylate synthase [Oscillospiraceae bacterium]|nr:L-threonylcarbamoyladenylate synthase [Oscillospiraceae bacterium]